MLTPALYPLMALLVSSQGAIVGWNEPYIYVLFTVGIVSLGFYVLAESRASKPVMPLQIWGTSGFTPVIVCMCLGWASFGIFLYYITTL